MRVRPDAVQAQLIPDALRESEERYRLLVDQSPYAIAIHQDGKLAFVNPAGVRLVGASHPDELIGRSIVDFVYPDGREAAGQRIRRMLAGETGLYPTEDHYVRLDGTVVPVEVTATPFVQQGRPAIQVIALDISERKQAEETLRQSEEHFRTAFEYSASGMCLTSLDGTLLRVNHAMVEMFGCSKEVLVGKHFNDIIHPNDLEIGRDLVRQMLSGEAPSAFFEKRYLRADGAAFWAHVTSAVVKDVFGQPLHFITQVEDIAERVQAEEALRRSEQYNRQLHNSSPIGLALCRMDGSLVDVNPAYAKIIGRTVEDLALNYWDITTEKYASQEAEQVRSLNETGVFKISWTGGKVPGTSRTSVPKSGSSHSLGQKVPGTL